MKYFLSILIFLSIVSCGARSGLEIPEWAPEETEETTPIPNECIPVQEPEPCTTCRNDACKEFECDEDCVSIHLCTMSTCYGIPLNEDQKFNECWQSCGYQYSQEAQKQFLWRVGCDRWDHNNCDANECKANNDYKKCIESFGTCDETDSREIAERCMLLFYHEGENKDHWRL
jgi:hypothetical protein